MALTKPSAGSTILASFIGSIVDLLQHLTTGHTHDGVDSRLAPYMRLIDSGSSSGGSPGISLSSIDTTKYKAYKLLVQFQEYGTSGASRRYIRFNGDSGNNYSQVWDRHVYSEAAPVQSHAEGVSELAVYQFVSRNYYTYDEIDMYWTGDRMIVNLKGTGHVDNFGVDGALLAGIWKSASAPTAMTMYCDATTVYYKYYLYAVGA